MEGYRLALTLLTILLPSLLILDIETNSNNPGSTQKKRQIVTETICRFCVDLEGVSRTFSQNIIIYQTSDY